VKATVSEYRHKVKQAALRRRKQSTTSIERGKASCLGAS
jgi:hypothetical protein